MHAFNPGTWGIEAGAGRSLEPAWSTERDSGQPGLRREILSPNQTKKDPFGGMKMSQ